MMLDKNQVKEKVSTVSWETLKRDLIPGNVGANIRYFREDIIELTQNDFAKKVNLTRSSLAHYETNARDVPLDALKRIADYLDISLDILVFRESFLESKREK